MPHVRALLPVVAALVFAAPYLADGLLLLGRESTPSLVHCHHPRTWASALVWGVGSLFCVVCVAVDRGHRAVASVALGVCAWTLPLAEAIHARAIGRFEAISVGALSSLGPTSTRADAEAAVVEANRRMGGSQASCLFQALDGAAADELRYTRAHALLDAPRRYALWLHFEADALVSLRYDTRIDTEGGPRDERTLLAW